MIVKLILTLCVVMLLNAPDAVAFEATPEQDQLVEQGVAFYDDEEFAKAKAILLPLAKAGHAKAMNYIGLLHYGTSVFPNNPKIECDWYERAANAGYPNAMYNMSICFDGNGRPNDPEIDKQWLQKAANHGVVDAMINLAWLDKDAGEEYRVWMNKAVKHGSVYAKVSLKLQGYEQDVPNVHIQDTLCVYIRILLFDGGFHLCD